MTRAKKKPAKKTPRPGARGKKTTPKKKPAKKIAREELVVFAFRLEEDERQMIHDAAGPAKASEFARTVLAAAARKDLAAIKRILKEVK